MKPCCHIKGFFVDTLLIPEEFKDANNDYLKKFDFWIKNCDSAVRNNIVRPTKPIEFLFCPICGERI